MANLELTLRDIARAGSAAVAVVGATLLAVALCAELARRHRADSVLVRVADRLVPTTVHRIVVWILTLLATATSVAVPSVASADTSLRGWLESPSVPTTVVAPGTDSAQSPAPPAAQPPPAPVATPSPSAAPVLHPRRPAIPPISAPAPARTPSTTPVRPTARAVSPRAAEAEAVDPPARVNRPVQYVVVAGDCLWDIAARLIGPSASNAAIDRGWRAIYSANRAAIGDDPGLIHPGLVLTIPVLDPTP